MADGVIRDFLVSLGFDTDNSGLANMRSAMDGIEWKAKALNGALMALATGAVLAVRQTASELDKLYFSSQRIGASVTNINAYGNAIAQLGGSAEGAVGSLESLAEKIRNSPGYEGQIKSLGVNTRDANGAMRDRVEVMKDLSGVLAKMPSYQANAYANSLGIDQNTLMAMRDGKFMANMEKYQKIQKELGLNDDLAKSGNEFMTEYRDLTMMTKTGFQVIVMQAGKALIPILRLLNQMIQMGISAFSQLHPAIKSVLAAGLQLGMFALVINGVYRSFLMLKTGLSVLKMFIPALKAFRLAFLATPLGWITALIIGLGAALALLYDDYKTWKEGGKSLFDWSKWTNGIDTIINKIKDFLDILDKIKDKTIEFIQKIITDPAGALKEVATEVQEGVAKVNDAVDKYVNPTDPKKVTPTQEKVAQVTDFAFSMVDKGLALIGNKGAQTRVDQRDRGEIGYKPQSGSIFDATSGAAKYLLGTVQGAVGSGGSGSSYENKDLGSVSAKYEGKIGSANKDVDQNGKPAGWAYGKFQFNSAKGGLQKFFSDNPDIAKQFKGLKPGTKAFNDKWKSLAQLDPIGFEQSQNKSAANLWFKPAEKAYANAGFNLNNRGVQEAVFSSSIQHGGVVRKLLPLAQKLASKNINELSAEEQIALIYDARKKYHSNGKKRYDSEVKDALKLSKQWVKPITPKGSTPLANFAQNAELPNIFSFGPPSGNPYKSQTNNSSAR